jgi:hypothetical protein
MPEKMHFCREGSRRSEVGGKKNLKFVKPDNISRHE